MDTLFKPYLWGKRTLNLEEEEEAHGKITVDWSYFLNLLTIIIPT